MPLSTSIVFNLLRWQTITPNILPYPNTTQEDVHFRRWCHLDAGTVQWGGFGIVGIQSGVWSTRDNTFSTSGTMWEVVSIRSIFRNFLFIYQPVQWGLQSSIFDIHSDKDLRRGTTTQHLYDGVPYEPPALIRVSAELRLSHGMVFNTRSLR
jgi:hypothetical protein